MKKIFSFSLIALAFVSCNKQYTQHSPEIDAYKKVIAAYEKQNFDDMAQYYADSAKVQNNVTKKNAQTVAQFVAECKKDAALFSTWDYVDQESEYEMVVTEKGETWVNFWGLWQGTLKANGKLYEIPTAITIRFIDGKIVRECGYWDISKILLDIQQMEQPVAMETPDKAKENTK